MKDRPIIYSAPMVRALLAGTKTQTRRFLTAACDEPPAFVLDGVVTALDERDRPYRWPRTAAAGDRLWAREAWRTFVSLDAVPPREILKPGRGAGILYEADNGGLAVTAAGERTMGDRDDARPFGKFRPGMFMPRWASRLTQVVTDVRVDRLQEISAEDAIAEGLQQLPATRRYVVEKGEQYFGFAHHDPRVVYSCLWDRVNGPGSWEANPWVVAYTVQTHHLNIDEMPAEEGAR